MNDYDKVLDSIRTVRDERDALAGRLDALIAVAQEILYNMHYDPRDDDYLRTSQQDFDKLAAALKAAKDGDE